MMNVKWTRLAVVIAVCPCVFRVSTCWILLQVAIFSIVAGIVLFFLVVFCAVVCLPLPPENQKPEYVKTNVDNVDLVIAHGPCSDGLCAAAIAKHYANIHKRKIDIEFIDHPMDLKRLQALVSNRNVLFVDITPGCGVLSTRVADWAKSLFILDHIDRRLKHMTRIRTCIFRTPIRTCIIWRVRKRAMCPPSGTLT